MQNPDIRRLAVVWGGLIHGRVPAYSVLPGHVGAVEADGLDFAFAHREKVCSVWFKQKPHDPDAPYDAGDESGDTGEKARTVRLQKQNRR